MPKIYFIIGVNGVGKSSVIPHLRTALTGRDFIVHDFDERGVPDNAGSDWRKSETRYWIGQGKENLEKGVSTIICGFSKPEEIQTASREIGVEVFVMLLDADASTITKRILGRYQTSESIAELQRTVGKTPEKFAADNVWVSTKFREAAKASGYVVIDTSAISAEVVAMTIVQNL